MIAVLQMQLPLIFALVALVGTAFVFSRVQSGSIKSRRIVVGATLLLFVSGTALVFVAIEDRAARAEVSERISLR